MHFLCWIGTFLRQANLMRRMPTRLGLSPSITVVGILVLSVSAFIGLRSLLAVPLGPPTFTIQATKSIGEGDGTVTVTVSLSHSTADPISVQVKTANNTATDTDDFTAITSSTLVFNPNTTTLSQDVTVTITNQGKRITAAHLIIPRALDLDKCTSEEFPPDTSRFMEEMSDEPCQSRFAA